MSKTVDPLSESMKVLKSATCDTLSERSKVTYQIGVTPESVIHLRISNNSGKGCYSNEWLAFSEIHDALKMLPKDTPISSYYLAHIFKGKSVNTPSFLLAALKHLKLVRALPNNKRHHELLDPRPFLEQVEKLTASGQAKPKTGGNTGGVTAVGAVTKKTATKKTGGAEAVKKKAMSRRKSTTPT